MEQKMKFKPLVCAFLVFAAPVSAETVEESIVRQLREQGFERIRIERTLLGRLRIEAYSSSLERELVVNPNTGEVLRDYWEALDNEHDDDFPRLSDPHLDHDSDDDDFDEEEDFEEDEDEEEDEEDEDEDDEDD